MATLSDAVAFGWSGGWPGLIAEDLTWGQWPVPEQPGEAVMLELAGERGRWDGQDGAPGVGQAVAADPGQHHPGERAAAASAYN